MWDLIELILGHCLSIYFTFTYTPGYSVSYYKVFLALQTLSIDD